MSIKLHRFKVGGAENTSFPFGATWVIGAGIFVILSSFSIFSRQGSVGFFLMSFIPLLILFYLSTNFPMLKYVLALCSLIISGYFLLMSFPNVFSDNIEKSAQGLYHLVLSVYFLGVLVSQLIALFKHFNKTLIS